MGIGNDIVNYNNELAPDFQALAKQFCANISETVPQAQGKLWHGHPVWFIDGNPIAGYSLKKAGLEVLFWSGQSFQKPGLKALGSFKAAATPLQSEGDFAAINEWLQEAIVIQWDYSNLPKKRVLEKLTSF